MKAPIPDLPSRYGRYRPVRTFAKVDYSTDFIKVDRRTGRYEIRRHNYSYKRPAVKEITWEEQRKGLGLNGKTEYTIKKRNGEIVTCVLYIRNQII